MSLLFEMFYGIKKDKVEKNYFMCVMQHGAGWSEVYFAIAM